MLASYLGHLTILLASAKETHPLSDSSQFLPLGWLVILYRLRRDWLTALENALLTNPNEVDGICLKTGWIQ